MDGLKELKVLLDDSLVALKPAWKAVPFSNVWE